jgi:hypothetical protein
LFSSSSRLRAASKSKMPPQQPDRLLDVLDNRLDFRAHGLISPEIREGNLMSGAADDKAKLIGTWTLVSAVREEIPSGRKVDNFGPNPHGFISYGADGRMLALITRSDRKAPAGARATPQEAEALYRSMLSYSGPYTLEDGVVTHHVDISWNESFTGDKQRRHYRFEDDLLILSTPQSLDPIEQTMSVRHMTWKRV